MKLWARRTVLLAIGLGLAGLLVWSFLPAPVAVDLGAVTRGRLEVTVDHEGRTRVRERYVVSSPLAGRLLRIALDPGDPIVAGTTLLAVIEPSVPELLDVRAEAQAEARVKAAEAARERAAPQLRRARASHALAESNLARVQKLSERMAASHQELDDAEHRLRVAAEDVKAAQFASQIADFELALARAALIQTRPSPAGATPGDPGRFEIKAPVNGRVLRVFQESEAAIASGTRLLEVGDPTDLEIEVDVLSADAVTIRPGDRVVLEHWGGTHPLTGRVRLVEPSAFTKVSALGVEEQRVNVVLDIVDPPSRRPSLGDAFRVEARIIVWEADPTLKAPAGALFHHGDGWAVFRARNGRARLQPVQIGRGNGLETQILAGLAEHDSVILHPTDRIHDGAAITSNNSAP